MPPVVANITEVYRLMGEPCLAFSRLIEITPTRLLGLSCGRTPMGLTVGGELFGGFTAAGIPSNGMMEVLKQAGVKFLKFALNLLAACGVHTLPSEKAG